MQSPLKTLESLNQTNAYQMPEYADYLKTRTCLDSLGFQQGIHIQERFEPISFGFPTPNVFRVYAADHLGDQIEMQQLFCLYRPKIRPFEMLVDNFGCSDNQLNKNQQFQSSDQTILKFKREYQCTCCCCNRPRLEVYYVENAQNKLLGYIIDPIYCCRIGCNILDSDNQLRYMIKASTCQSYFWCRCPCSIECNKIGFDIKLPTGEVVAPMLKQVKTCCNTDSFSICDNISAMFPQKATTEDKALILAATIMIEFMYFEKPRSRSTQ
ncbi:unnamed protein product (macronuclear) [Paramecium tetraurelia]|uniref:Phospholipid scramblase n=1 Tax=Paramecium tetraurelia TaxID=5888 RepID=A0D691_PARTE|nr:uncharacterized protein GSPATT00039290001 [Paramecium tetraurelia]CAK78558.1 unnamed protein product [Paramecium tetraurelia]|eukprot:XP_001445955.1 hypothetical protein (macronuclear) [Paramecium tetraurelia strain d4-2]